MNKSAIIASALAVAAGGFGLWERVALSRTEAALADLDRDRTRLQSELGNVKQRLAAVNERVVQAEVKAAGLKNDFGQIFTGKEKDPAPAIPAPGARSSFSFVPGVVRRGGASLTFLRSMLSAKSFDTTYHVLYRELKFSPEQIEQFKAIMNGAAAHFEDLRREANQRNVGAKDRTLQALNARADADLRESLIAHFGADALPVMQHFNETLFLRDVIAQMATDLFYTDAPLTEPQANQLVEILAKNMRDPKGQLNTVFADAEAMKRDAAKVLAPAQLAVWRQLIDYLVGTSFMMLNAPRQ